MPSIQPITNTKNVGMSIFPGKKPNITAPKVKVNSNSNGYLNNFSGTVFSMKGKNPIITKPGNTSVKVNKDNLLDRLRKVEELLGYNRTAAISGLIRPSNVPTTSVAPPPASAPASAYPTPSVTVTVGNIGTTGRSRLRARPSSSRREKTPVSWANEIPVESVGSNSGGSGI